ncbi:tetratricopeptide repeat protein [uncultured Methanomethylovorans sp.]|uniref:tetratricopeptide repeat protein n=1 Tax=uncultured Methanomethylovorans sp. TaxID=183759 RepID=UPI002606566B|nr:tetratricopeptide repeat protein [uncultured Methanomethylovorans sp.]
MNLILYQINGERIDMSSRERDMAIRYLNKGVSLKEKGLHAEALENFKKAEEHSWEAASPALLATVMQNFGELLEVMGNEEGSFDQYSLAVAKLERLVEVSPSFKEQLATTLSKFASMLVDRGKKEEGKANYEKAVILYRELRREYPKNVQIRSNMISTLNNLGALLADMGMRDEAQWKFERALKMLDDKRCPAENYTHCFENKSMVLENLANLLIESGELEQAREKLENVLNIYFSLLDQGHMTELYRSRVALVLSRIAHLSVSLDRKEDALKSYASLAQMYGELAKLGPENEEMRIERASVLASMADLLEGMHEDNEAISRYEEALGILKDVQASEEPSKYPSMIIPVQLDLSRLLVSQDRVPEGLEKLEKVIELISLPSGEKDMQAIDLVYSYLMQICEQLSAKMGYEVPGVFAQLLGMHSKLSSLRITQEGQVCKARIMEALGRIQMDAGEKKLAVGTLMEAVDIYTQLNDTYNYSSEIADLSDIIEANMPHIKDAEELQSIYYGITGPLKEEGLVPEQTAHAGSIMDTQERLADMALDKGRYEQAFDLYLEIYSADRSREGVLNKAADVLGKLEADMHLNKRSGNILKDMEFLTKGYALLAEMEPADSEHRRNLAAIEKEMGKVLLDTGHVDDARQRYCQALDNYLVLMDMPGNKHHLKGMYAVLKELTALLPAIGDKEKELQCQEKITLSYSRMCELDPLDAGLVEDLAASLDHQASLLAVLDRKKDAYELLNQALDKYELLYQLESSYKHAGKAAVAMNNMGTLLARMGRKEEAKQMLEDALRIYNYLLDQEPDNTEHMVHAACTLDNMGTLFANMDRPEDAKHMYESALQIYMDATGVDPDDASYNEYAALTMENLGAVLERMGRRDDAKWMHENAKKLRNGEA